MLRHTSEIHGYAIGAADGQIGCVADLLFDDVSWMARWLVVDTGSFLSERKVLLPPSALSRIDHPARQFSVTLTKQQITDSPSIRTDEPVSSQMETDLYDHYGWSPYWAVGFPMGGYGYTSAPSVPNGLGLHPRHREEEVARRTHSDRHLRSVREVTGYHIQARDGEIGHVADFLLEDEDWSIHYLVVATKNWWPGKKVLVSPRSIKSTDWSTGMVNIDVERQALKDSPAYDGSSPIDGAYEHIGHGDKDGRRVAEPV